MSACGMAAVPAMRTWRIASDAPGSWRAGPVTAAPFLVGVVPTPKQLVT
jgi:hypothetical protein